MSGRVRLLIAACGLLYAGFCHATPDFAGERASDDARYAAARVLAGADHQGRPFAIVDKKQARIHVFDPAGRLLGAAAVLLGIGPGDLAPGDPGRGAGALGLDERTTPAGRFDTAPGRNDKGEAIVWIDYAQALAIHRLRPGPARERRAARLASPTPADNRVSAGCIVVPVAFYQSVIAPVLGARRGVVYVLPESRPVRALFDAVEIGLAAQ